MSASLSAYIVRYLQDQGKTRQEIAELLDLGQSFISRVANQERHLTIEHLVKLEERFGQPLPLLLLEAIPAESIPTELKQAYQALVRVLRAPVHHVTPQDSSAPTACERNTRTLKGKAGRTRKSGGPT